MESWREKLRVPCGIAGIFCLLAAVWASMRLEQGSELVRAGIAGTMLILAGLSIFLLWAEGFERGDLLIMLLPVGIAVLARTLCLDYMSGDYVSFLSVWYRFFQENGGFWAISTAVGDYNVPYLYFMALISYIHAPDLYLIKLFSIVFDVILAWGCLRLTRSLCRERQGSAAPLIAFGAALLLPTVILNGAYWGQCDVIYGALVVHAVALVLEGKNKTSIVLMGLAFAFKLQAIFVLPLWGVLWLAKKVKFRELWVFPLTYLVVILPAVLLGKPLSETLLVYVNQMGEYPKLTLNAPSVFQLVPYEISSALSGSDPLMKGLSTAGIVVAAVLVAVLLMVGYFWAERMDRETLMGITVVLAIGVPFFLPHMHERYFFLADVLALCWACADAHRIPVAVLVQAASAASYRVYLRLKFNFWLNIGGHRYVMLVETALMLVALMCAAGALIVRLRLLGGEKRSGEFRK